MTFFNTRSENSENKFEKTEFLNFDFGQHLVRVLGEPKLHVVHFIPRHNSTIKCLDEDCIICKNNKQLISEHPEDFRNQNGYIAKQYRHYVNILDRTVVKVCPQCGKEHKRGINGLFSTACLNTSCGTFLTNVDERPSNKIKVANISETNAQKLNAYDMSVLDSNGNPIGLKSFDVLFVVTKTGKRKDISPVPVVQNTDAVEYDESKLFNLDRVIIELTPDELEEHLKGITLRDIFAARNPAKDVVVGEDAPQELEKVARGLEEVQKRIDQLF